MSTGPFAIVRNPLYIGNIALWVGFSLAAHLPQLAAINWNVSESLSLVAALPAISLAARLQAIMPSLSLNPCGASCPMQALAA